MNNDRDLTIKEVKKEAFETAWEKGWYENESTTFAEHLAWVHAEVSEVYEEFRNWNDYNEIYYNLPSDDDTNIKVQYSEVLDTLKKPRGIPVELADVIIKTLDICAHYGIDIERAVKIKLEYNKTRPYKHGGKRI